MPVEFLNVTKRFGPNPAVEGISLQIKEGERLVILGPSGSGKTTLIRLLAGLEIPDQGEIRFDGKVASLPGKILIPLHERGIGMVFQDLALWPHLTVRGNIEFGLRAKGLDKNICREKIEKAMSLVSLKVPLDSYPSQLSGGEQQRLALARAIAPESEILLLDEPMANLDPDLREEIEALILKLSSELGITIVHVTHEHGEALRLANNLAVMRKGKIEQIGSKEEIISNPASRFVEEFLRKT